MLKPTIKMRNEQTFHKDNTISFFNAVNGEWERDTVQRRNQVFKLIRETRKSGGKLYKGDFEKRQEIFNMKEQDNAKR